jgi:hypothetical protein
MKIFYILHTASNEKPFIDASDLEDVMMLEDEECGHAYEQFIKDNADESRILYDEDEDVYEIAHNLPVEQQKNVIESIYRMKSSQVSVFISHLGLYQHDCRVYHNVREVTYCISEYLKDYTFESYGKYYNNMSVESVKKKFNEFKQQFSGNEMYGMHIKQSNKNHYILKFDYLVLKAFSEEVKKIINKDPILDEDGMYKMKKNWLTNEEAVILENHGLPFHENHLICNEEEVPYQLPF